MNMKIPPTVMVKTKSPTCRAKKTTKMMQLMRVAVGAGWQAFVAYVNVGCYYLFGIPLGLLMGFALHWGVLAPSVVFIDELDSVGRERGLIKGSGGQERDATLNQLLVCLDGFEGRGEVITIASTNRPDILDPALVRPGRFDRKIYIPKPGLIGRLEILKVI
ncbi:ATP-dependent zinc metalloprotease FTSH 5 [Cucumis melo var. makuwa]|uniref:ATP-dependent zinc metalloprotease FTSH 5 n=1 Tax=Cucumis melo var. makuwa TaxID=1194695 RepID=A0A5D3CG97_CUCMM|nr:ATP-dependent zinc metalloprotease FTSH 5 [Cucumis melo var. makuwa]